MKRPPSKAPDALKTVMECFSISNGDRGEFIVLLLFIMARDELVGPADHLFKPFSGKRHFPLADFIYGHLFRKHSAPTQEVNESSLKALASLESDFPNAQLHMNHFVKVHEHKVITLASLLLLQGRGAGVLCGSNRQGLDAAISFLHDGPSLVETNGGLLQVQIKNDESYRRARCRPLCRDGPH